MRLHHRGRRGGCGNGEGGDPALPSAVRNCQVVGRWLGRPGPVHVMPCPPPRHDCNQGSTTPPVGGAVIRRSRRGSGAIVGANLGECVDTPPIAPTVEGWYGTTAGSTPVRSGRGGCQIGRAHV